MAIALHQEYRSAAPIEVLGDGWKRPGCTDRCTRVRAILIGRFGASWIEQHDIDGHEAYGSSLGVLNAVAVEDVCTGPLAVRLLHANALVDGASINLTPTEYRVLVCLALRAGRVVGGQEILCEVWGPEYVPAVKRGAKKGEWHLLRVNIARLRAKLGDTRRLLVTRPGIGYMLAAEPYTGPSL